MARSHELESLRRSIAKLEPQAKVLTREEATALVTELKDVMARLNDSAMAGLTSRLPTSTPAAGSLMFDLGGVDGVQNRCRNPEWSTRCLHPARSPGDSW